MSNRPKYKLRERPSSRKQNTQISKFFKSEDNLQSPNLYENNDPDFSSDGPPSKKNRESPQEPENTASTQAPIPTCSKTDPLEVEKEESETSLPKKSSISGKNKRTTKSTTKNSIKQFLEQNDSDSEYAPKKKIARKATVQKTNSRAKRGGGRTKARQTTIKSALLKNEEIFSELVAQHSKAENIDPNEFQLALAISKSEIETSRHCGGSGSAEEENTDLIKSTRERLKKYGFKVTGSERDYDIIFKTGSRKGKWANKFSPLILRDSETQAKKLEKKVAQILKCFNPEALNSSCHTKNDFVMTSDFLKMYIADRDLCRTLHQIDSDYVYDYYVIGLFPASDTKVGYLLKDWRKIPGRDLSPPRIKTEIKNEIPEVILNITENENDQAIVITDASSVNENAAPKVIFDLVENKNDSPDQITNVLKYQSNLVVSIPNASENEDSFKKIQYLPQNELSEEIILNDNDRLAVNISENLNVSMEYTENQNVLCTQKTVKGKEIGVISLVVSDAETVEERKKDFVVEKKNLMDSDYGINTVRYQQRETSPDLFADSDTSFCETIEDCKDSEQVPSPSNLETFSEKNQLEPVVDNFVISYEKYSSDEVKVSSNITLETLKSANNEFLRKPSLEEYCIDLTCNSNSNSATLSQEIKNENSEINNPHNTAVFETIMPEMNLLQVTQKSDCGHNLSQSQNNHEMDLTGESCIVLSDDEVNYSIKVANKIFFDLVDLTFSSSSEDDQEKRRKTNYSIKVPGPEIDQNFSFIALIGETDIVSPSKSVESLNIDSPMKMSQKTNFENDSITSVRRNLLSPNASFKHDYNKTARKSLSFSNYTTNISSEYKISPYVERSAPYILEDDELSTKGCSILLNQNKNFNKQISSDEELSDVEHGLTFSKLRKSWSPPCTITSTTEHKKENILAKSSSSYSTLSDSYIKTKTMESSLLKKYSISQKFAPYNLPEDKFMGKRLDYNEFDDNLLSTKPSNFNKLLSSDEEFSDDEHNVVTFSKHRKSRTHSHTITSTVEKKKEIILEKSSCSNRALSDSFVKTSTVMKSPILKRYPTSEKFNKFITDDVDFSDVDEIDKLVYSPIKKLSPKKPQGMDKLLHAELSFTETNSPRKYVHDGKTYLVRTENISPKPDYGLMDSPTILKKLYNYGIKPLKRKHAVAILEHIYDQTHPFVIENDDGGSSDDEGVLRISSSPLKGLQIQKDKKSRSSSNTFNLKDSTGEKLLDFDDLLPEIDEEDYIFPTNVRSKVSTASLPFHIAWYNVVKSSYSLREAILHYEPIDLQEIYLFLKKLGYRYDPKDMKKFFDKRSITFRYDLSDGTSNRHVRKNKEALSQRSL